MPRKRLVPFIAAGVVALQIVARVQHGAAWDPTVHIAPLAIGVGLGVIFWFVYHSFVEDRNRLKRELAETDRLLKALKLSEDRLALATSRSAIWDWNIVTDELYLSDGFRADLGYTKEELTAAMNGSTVNLLHPDDRASYLQELQRHLRDPSKPFLHEHRFLTKSGAYKWFLALGQATLNDAGDPVRFAGTTTDVSDRVKLEKELQEAYKFEAIGKLTGGVAHDFNNLLTVVMGNLELMREGSNNPETLQMIDAGLTASRRGADLTKSMLAFARKSRLEPEIINLNDVVRHAKNWMHRGIPETVNVELSLLPGLWRVHLDTATLENALLNLLLNATDAMDGKGKLTIQSANVWIDDVQTDARDQQILPGRYVMLAVKDTGSGIPPEVLPDIFTPFFTTKETGKGSGMGLAMVEGFVKQSGGTVQVFTEVGLGTTIKLYFSAVDLPSTLRETPAQAAIAPVSRADIHLLLAEDDPAVRVVIENTLKSAGYHVTCAETGDRALELFKQHRFDLVVTDIVMPGRLQGTGLAKAIRELAPDMPIIFMSGYASEATVHGNGLRPLDIRLIKPVPRVDLLKAVSDMIS